VAVGFAVGLGVAVGFFVGFGVAVGFAVGFGVGFGVGLGVGAGVATVSGAVVGIIVPVSAAVVGTGVKAGDSAAEGEGISDAGAAEPPGASNTKSATAITTAALPTQIVKRRFLATERLYLLGAAVLGGIALRQMSIEKVLSRLNAFEIVRWVRVVLPVEGFFSGLRCTAGLSISGTVRPPGNGFRWNRLSGLLPGVFPILRSLISCILIIADSQQKVKFS
jgi:hypothetical protein